MKCLRLEPTAYANPHAIAAIEAADLIIIGPGNYYCSVIPNLLVKGIAESIGRSRALVVYNYGLMNKAGHTDGYVVHDYVMEVERFIGEGRINADLVSTRPYIQKSGDSLPRPLIRHDSDTLASLIIQNCLGGL